MRYPLWCGKNKEENKRCTERVRETEEEKAINWAADKKKDWGREEEMEIDYCKIETMVPMQFH